MLKIFMILVLFTYVSSQGQQFRFDYEFSTQAGGWLKFHQIPGTWREARMRCNAEGAVLASPITNQLKSGLIALVKKHKDLPLTTIFTGVHASFSKGDYSSIEGVPLARLSINWAPYEPDNYANAESCLAMLTDDRGSMSDVRCGDVLPYVCYKADSVLTMNECGTTDPGQVAATNSTETLWFTCVAEGGYLTVIDSATELEVVKTIYKNNLPSTTKPWRDIGWLGVGFHDWGERTHFRTIHDKPLKLGYLKWSENEPSNSSNSVYNEPGEFCGSVNSEGFMNDINCGGAVPFMCEKKPSSLLNF